MSFAIVFLVSWVTRISLYSNRHRTESSHTVTGAVRRTRPQPHTYTKHSLSICQFLTSTLNGLTTCCDAGPEYSGDLFDSTLCLLHFRCSPDQTRVHMDSGNLPCVQLTAYHVFHVPLHLIHPMVILHLGTSCTCGSPCEVSLRYRRDCTS